MADEVPGESHGGPREPALRQLLLDRPAEEGHDLDVAARRIALKAGSELAEAPVVHYEKDAHVGAGAIALTAGATVLDQLAWLLGHAAQLSKDIGSQLKNLIGAIFSFLGRKVVGAADVTVAFLRWVLALLFESLRAVALRALALVS